MKIEILKIREAKGSIINASLGVYAEMAQESRADREILWVIHLNSANKVIEKEVAAIGHLEGLCTTPREIFKKAVLNSTARIIVVHNHPSGDLEPSIEDKAMCEGLCYVSKLLGVDMVDFVIISPDGYFSFADEGIIKELNIKASQWINGFGFIGK